MGLECDSPAMGAFHAILVPLPISQVTGSFWPSAAPEASGPRNEGQFCAAAPHTARKIIKPTLRTRRVYQSRAAALACDMMIPMRNLLLLTLLTAGGLSAQTTTLTPLEKEFQDTMTGVV